MPIPKRSFFGRLIHWRFLIIVNMLVIVFLGLSLGREIMRSRVIEAQIAELQAQADALSARNIDLSGLKTAMQTESYIEREARLKLGLKKPGETVVVVQEEVENGAQEMGEDATDPLGYVLTGDTSQETAVANPTKWWYYFFDTQAFQSLVNDTL